MRFFLFTAILIAQLSADTRSDGNALAKSSQSALGGSNLVNALGNPLVSNGKMKTMNGKEFDAKLICSSTNNTPFLTMSLSGSGEGTLTAQMDKNLDGTKELSWTFSGISGVCANGVIKCSSGTWNSCTYQKWQFTGGVLALQSASINDLGGCFCTNNSCGNLVVSQHDYVLDTLGSGASSAIVSSNSTYVISNRAISSGVLNLWAQDTRCTDASASKPPLFNERDDSQILSQAQTTQVTQLSTGTGLYSDLSRSIDSQNNENTSKHCKISNDVGFTGSGVLNNTHTDTCAVYATDSTCKLDSEAVFDKTNYSVSTIKDGKATGATPLTSCTSLSYGGADYSVCADGSTISYFAQGGATAPLYSTAPAWWKIERSYICKSPQNNDFTAMKQRTATAKSTSSWDGSAVSYTNQYQDKNGAWHSQGDSAEIYTFASDKAKFCEVQWTAQNNDVFSDQTNRSTQNNNSTVIKTEIRECTTNWTVCPISTGESILHDCGAINDFGQAVGALNAVSETAKDCICSLQ